MRPIPGDCRPIFGAVQQQRVQYKTGDRRNLLRVRHDDDDDDDDDDVSCFTANLVHMVC